MCNTLKNEGKGIFYAFLGAQSLKKTKKLLSYNPSKHNPPALDSGERIISRGDVWRGGWGSLVCGSRCVDSGCLRMG